jgi:hypothetical protein
VTGVERVVDLSRDRLTLEGLGLSRAQRLQFIGLGWLGLSVVVGLFRPESFFRGYLLNLCFFVSLALGALWFVMLQHLTRAGWSVVVRRLAELLAGTFPLLALLSLPIVIPVALGMPAGIRSVYPWTDPAYVAQEALLQHKQPYLNGGFFLLRAAVYFGVWWLLSGYLLRRSLEQDASGDPSLTLRMERASAPGMLAYALTVTFFAFDFMMTLAPTWYSTIFGVYYFSGCVLGFFATLTLTMFLLQRAGRLTEAISVEHYHDVGKLLFAFVVFWAYIAYSQYMLYWYANMPETSSWYVVRQSGPWVWLSLVILFGHFVLPFLLLISRVPKRRKTVLVGGAVWVLAVHWLDIAYLVLPPYFFGFAGDPGYVQGERVRGAPFDPVALILGLTLLIGLGGVLAGSVLKRMELCCLIPRRDPRLHESLEFENI